MNATYEIINKHEVRITAINSKGSVWTFTQEGFPNLGIAWTNSEAITWAEETVQAINSSDDTWRMPVYSEDEIKNNFKNFCGDSSPNQILIDRAALIAND